MSFTYLMEKIRAHQFDSVPFRHLEVLDFFNEKHFAEITTSPEVALRPFTDDTSLIEGLKEHGFAPISFPGTTDNIGAYLKWHAGRRPHDNVDTCEGVGITFRLMSAGSPLLEDLNAFFNSDPFLDCVAEKFDIDRGKTYVDNGLQKYLDGYEISPHPDIRRKALTYMINVNPGANSENENIHTHYLEFDAPYRYVGDYWKYNPGTDCCWVPWEWCRTVKRQTQNNSFVMFSPSPETLHAVRARYDHLPAQRTQFYGNLWYTENPQLMKPHWADFVITPTPEKKHFVSFKDRVKRVLTG